MLNAVAALPTSWRWVNPLPSGDIITIVRNGFGQFVASGPSGGVLDSTNGVDWVARAPVHETIFDLAIGPGATVMVGEAGLILVSSDRVNWQRANSRVTSDIAHVLFHAGKFLAWTTSGLQIESPNGLDWTIAAELGIQVQLGGNVLATNGIVFLNEFARAYAFFDDGRRVDLPQLVAFAYANGTYVAAARDGFYGSTNGVDWTRTQALDGARLVTYGNGIFLAASWTNFWSSTDGKTWDQLPATDLNYVTTLTFADGMFFAANGGSMHYDCGVYTSIDGREWTRRARSLLPRDLGVGVEQGLELASDENFLYAFDNKKIFRTADFATWEVVGATPAEFTWLRFARMPNGFIFVGENKIYFKPDNADAREIQGPTNTIRFEAVAYGYGIAVITGYGGMIFTTSDLTNWVETPPVADYWHFFSGVSFNDGAFVLYTLQNSPTENVSLRDIRLSQDGRTWRTINASGIDLGVSIALKNGKLIFATTGSYPFSLRPPALVVTDENLHVLERSVAPVSVQDLEFWKGSFVLSGMAGALLLSDPVRDLQISLQPQPRLAISGFSATTPLRIEFSTNLSTPGWTLFTNTTAAQLPSHILPNEPSIFFRAIAD